jgi:hypothetical protein
MRPELEASRDSFPIYGVILFDAVQDEARLRRNRAGAEKGVRDG